MGHDQSSMYKGRGSSPSSPEISVSSIDDPLLNKDGERQNDERGQPQPKVTVRASKGRYPYCMDRGHRSLGYWRIPVTDLIPLERVNSGETGEPSRVRGEVHVRGVDVRFVINMAVGTSVVGAMYDAKIQSDPVAISNGVNGRPEYFTIGSRGALLSTDGVGMVTEDGPFAIVSGGHGVSLDSPDGSLHLARMNMGERRPVGEAQWENKERKGKVFRQDFRLEGLPQWTGGGYVESYVDVSTLRWRSGLSTA